MVFLFSLSGQGFEQSIRMSIGALTSSGGLVAETARNLQPDAEALLIAALLIGRLEILALLPALNPSFWRR
jgi:Trk-type K+ transport system membrane component